MKLSPYPITFPLQASYSRVYLGYYIICNVNMKRAKCQTWLLMRPNQSFLSFLPKTAGTNVVFTSFAKITPAQLSATTNVVFWTHISSPLSFFSGASRFISNHFCSLLIFPEEILIRRAGTRFPACLTFIPPVNSL